MPCQGFAPNPKAKKKLHHGGTETRRDLISRTGRSAIPNLIEINFAENGFACISSRESPCLRASVVKSFFSLGLKPVDVASGGRRAVAAGVVAGENQQVVKGTISPTPRHPGGDSAPPSRAGRARVTSLCAKPRARRYPASSTSPRRQECPIWSSNSSWSRWNCCSNSARAARAAVMRRASSVHSPSSASRLEML